LVPERYHFLKKIHPNGAENLCFFPKKIGLSSVMDHRGYTGKKKERLLSRLDRGIAYASSDRILQICQDSGLHLIRSYWSGLLYTAWLFERHGQKHLKSSMVKMI